MMAGTRQDKNKTLKIFLLALVLLALLVHSVFFALGKISQDVYSASFSTMSAALVAVYLAVKSD
jgi:hypothetical protein